MLLPRPRGALLSSPHLHSLQMSIADPWTAAAPLAFINYADLHAILALPTLALLWTTPPLRDASPTTLRSSHAFLVWIVCIGVAQSFCWDYVGASSGYWEFNPAKYTRRTCACGLLVQAEAYRGYRGPTTPV